MDDVTIRELRNHGGEVIDRVAAGETIRVTRDGRAVAELHPIPRQHLSARDLLQRWRAVPPIDAAALRADIDDLIDTTL